MPIRRTNRKINIGISGRDENVVSTTMNIREASVRSLTLERRNGKWGFESGFDPDWRETRIEIAQEGETKAWGSAMAAHDSSACKRLRPAGLRWILGDIIKKTATAQQKQDNNHGVCPSHSSTRTVY